MIPYHISGHLPSSKTLRYATQNGGAKILEMCEGEYRYIGALAAEKFRFTAKGGTRASKPCLMLRREHCRDHSIYHGLYPSHTDNLQEGCW